MNINKYDIVIFGDIPVQYLGREMENGAIIQDVHTKRQLVHINLVKRKATKDEVKWFCENTEHSSFNIPIENS